MTKVSELTGRKLDEWVARAEGYGVYNGGTGKWSPGCWIIDKDQRLIGYLGGDHVPQWAPSTDPAQGQPIMERERIATTPVNMFPNDVAADGEVWTAYHVNSGHGVSASWMGPTQLVAAMRFRVAQVYGAEVPA